jgi:hypothetical protein
MSLIFLVLQQSPSHTYAAAIMRSRYAFLLFVLFGCTVKEEPVLPVRAVAFKKFVARQRLVDLPIHFDLDEITDSLTQPMIADVTDTLFMPKSISGGRIWGLYRDTTRFYMFVTFATAAGYVPEIRVFDKAGNKIQDEEIFIAGCGSDCGYTCNSISGIYKDVETNDVRFYARDSVFSYTCDSAGNETPGTREHYINYKSGTVDKDGHIYLRTGSVNLVTTEHLPDTLTWGESTGTFKGVVDGKAIVFEHKDFVIYRLTVDGKQWVGSLNTERGYRKDRDATVFVLDHDQPESQQKYFVWLSNGSFHMLDSNRKILPGELENE